MSSEPKHYCFGQGDCDEDATFVCAIAICHDGSVRKKSFWDTRKGSHHLMNVDRFFKTTVRLTLLPMLQLFVLTCGVLVCAARVCVSQWT